MIRQLLLFKFKKSISQEEIAKFFKAWEELVNKLPSVDSLEHGKNTSTEGYDQGYTHGAIASFKTKNNVEDFLKDTDHLKFIDDVLDPLLEDIIIVQI